MGIADVDAGNLAFFAACLVNLVDIMGVSFTSPALVPYGESIGATSTQVALFQTIRYLFGIVSMLWMPKLADKYGVKLCLMVSILGSALGYAVQASAIYFADCDSVTNRYLSQDSSYWLEDRESCSVTSGTAEWQDVRAGFTATSAATLECSKSCTEHGVTAMLVGRSIGGFFGGTQPVLRSFVTALSMPDFALLKFRVTVLFASSQAGNVALAPICGLIIRWGLNLPWVVCVGTAVVVFFVAWFLVRPVEEVKALQLKQARGELNKESAIPAEAPAAAAEEEENAEDDETAALPKNESQPLQYDGPPPWRDRALWCFLIAYIFLFCSISGMMLMLPWLLAHPDYGLVDNSSADQTLKNIAQGTSLIMVPYGLMNLVCSTVGFLVLSSIVGDMNCLRFGSFVATIALAIYGYVTNAFWQLCLLHGITGLGVGILVPAVGPTVQRYNSLAHPKRMAQASAFPMFGLQIGMVVGPLLFSAICGEEQERSRMDMALLVGGIFFFCGYICFELGFIAIAVHPVTKMSKLTPEQVQRKLETHAIDEDKFIDEMCSLVRLMLTKGNPEYRNVKLWSGNAQRFIRRCLSDSIPKLANYEEVSQDEYLQSIGDWLSKSGTDQELQFFTQRFPHIHIANRNNALHGALIGSGMLDQQGPLTARENSGLRHRTRTRSDSGSTEQPQGSRNVSGNVTL